jgi:hypothetical protein
VSTFEYTWMGRGKPHRRPAKSRNAREVRERSSQELAELAERESQALLSVSWEDARRMLDRGELAGTAVEAELRMLAFLDGLLSDILMALPSTVRLGAIGCRSSSEHRNAASKCSRRS